MTQHTLRKSILHTALSVALLAPAAALACETMGPSTHMGQLLSVDAGSNTFTIRDAQSRSPITFTTNADIINHLQGYAGSLMVNYEKSDSGLNATGVTF